jgi:membrane protein YdbS with pleckstrin-like domain
VVGEVESNVAYPRSLLNDGEEIILDRHPHWSFMLGAAAMVAFAVLFTIVIGIAFGLHLIWLGFLAIVLTLLGGLGRFLRWRTTEFAITTDRIIVRQGILSKQGLEIPLERVMNISYSQALWERILGTGNLIIESAGENGHQSFSDVENPSGVQNMLYRQMEIASNPVMMRPDGLGDHDRRRDPRARDEDDANDGSRSRENGLRHRESGHSASESIPDQIAKLGELRDRGILTDEEFQKKKRQLLDRM